MPQVLIGKCYGVVGWGEMEPLRPKGGQFAALYTVNLRLADVGALLRLHRPPYTVEFGREALAVWIEFVELVARVPGPLRGRAVYREGPLYVAMGDRHLAGHFGLSLKRWQAIAEALKCGTGVGVLECVEARIDVSDEATHAAYERRRLGGDQLELFERLRTTEPNELTNEETEPNRTGKNEPLTGERGRLAYDECRRLCLSSTEGGPIRAEAPFIELLGALLGEPSDRDLDQWGQIFGRMWGPMTAGADEGPYRAMRVELAYREARRIAGCENIRTPKAVFTKWAKAQGLLAKRRGVNV